MQKLAERLGENTQEWELVGLLHDLDFDMVRGDMSKHGVVAAEKLQDKLPEDCLYAIKAHDYRSGFRPRRLLDNALLAVDSLAVVMEKIKDEQQNLDKRSLIEKLEALSLEEPWHEGNIKKCKDFGLSVDEFLELAMDIEA
jgi:predicted hydrolase (HD superfamily)